LQILLERFGCSETGQALLIVAEEHGLEGVVSKRRNAPYSLW